MRHVAPHRWADLAAGRLDDTQARALEQHADGCPRCAAARDRILSTSGSFPAIRAQEAPELEWNEVWARVYWQTSSERRSGQRPVVRRRRWPLIAAPAGLAAAALLTWQLSQSNEAARPMAAVPAPTAVVAATAPDPAPAAPVLEPLEGLVTFAQGEVLLDDEPLAFDAPITAGATLRTGDGRLTVQFGDRTGFTLGPDSRVELRTFDRGAVELAVDGALSLEVSRRDREQRFSVIAGQRQVIVRGTAFRVDHRGGALDVACSHGRVVVADGDTQRPVDAGYRLRLRPGADLLAAVLEELAEAQRHVMQGSPTMPLLVAWTEPATLQATSAMLEVGSKGDAPVSIDGIEVASGTFRMRVMSGRHRIDAAGDDGRGTWVETRPGAIAEASIEGTTVPPPLRDDGVPARRARLRKALHDSSAVRGCLSPLDKQGLVEGSYVVLDLGVEADGTLSHLNVGDTNMPRSVASCIRDVADDVRFVAGSAADFEYRLEL